MGLRTFVLSAVLGAWIAPPALADQKLHIAPAELTGYVGQNLKIAYELPCGATFYGVVAKAETETKLRVGIAYLMGNIRCASIPQREERLLNYIHTTGFKSIAPLKVTGARVRYVQDNMIDVRILRKAKKPSLQLVYQPSCGVIQGTLIRQKGEHVLEVAQIEKLGSSQSRASCPSTQHIKEIRSIRITPKLDVRPIPLKVRNIERSYALRLAPVPTRSIKRLKKRGVTLKYLRACNDAPVGIVMDTTGKKKVAVGMLVAHYFNLKCAGKKSWAHYSNPAVFISKRRTVVPMKRGNTKGLRLLSPTAFSRRGSTAKTGVSIEYINSCSQVLGAVYVGQGKRAHVGVLTKADNKSCRKQVAEVSMYQPFLSKKVRLKNLTPLQLKGSIAH